MVTISSAQRSLNMAVLLMESGKEAIFSIIAFISTKRPLLATQQLSEERC